MKLVFENIQAVLFDIQATTEKLKVDVPAAILAASGGADDATNQQNIDGITVGLSAVKDALAVLDTSISKVSASVSVPTDLPPEPPTPVVSETPVETPAAA